jgi:hypothetical protein
MIVLFDIVLISADCIKLGAESASPAHGRTTAGSQRCTIASPLSIRRVTDGATPNTAPVCDLRLASLSPVQRLFSQLRHSQTLPPSMLSPHYRCLRASALLAVVSANTVSAKIAGAPILVNTVIGPPGPGVEPKRPLLPLKTWTFPLHPLLIQFLPSHAISLIFLYSGL